MKKHDHPEPAKTGEETNNMPWKPGQKFSFRFLFVFLGLSTYLCWDFAIFLTYTGISTSNFDVTKAFKPLTGLLLWLDKHIYHIGYTSKTYGAFPGDNHFALVYYITLLAVSIMAAIIWSVLDKKRINYYRLAYWFSLYLRFVLAIIVFGYGIDKLIPVQMGRPNAMMMLSPYGNLNRFNVLWTFMGISPGYMMFSGTLEVIAALLLFFRRTAIAGYTLTSAILLNVVALNWFYNVPVKLFSALLLLYSLFLLAPYLRNIFQFFFVNKAAPIRPDQYLFETKWKKNLLVAVLIIVPLMLMLPAVYGTHLRYRDYETGLRKEKIYEVTAFVAKDTLPPLLTDTLRWRRVFMYIYGDQFVISDMKDRAHWYDFDVDTVKKTFSLHHNPNKATWKIFHYTYPSKDQLQMTGKWKGKDISVTMKLSPVDSIPLNKEEIKFIQEQGG